MNKKIAASAVIIVIVAASIADWLINNQLSELQRQKKIEDAQKVCITRLSSPTGWMCMGGMLGFIELNVTISNTGVSDVERLMLEMKMLGRDKDPYYAGFPTNSTIKLDILHAGETTEIQHYFRYGWEEGIGCSYSATLKLDEIVLDIRYLSL
jgi:hypothetical protein